MFSKNKSASLVAAVVGAFILALTQPPVVANAAAKATARNTTMSVTSARLIVFPADTSTASNPSAPYVVAVDKSTPRVFFIRNAGELTTSQFTFTITLDSGAKISTLHRCNVNVFFSATLKKCGPTSVNATQIVGVATASPYTTTQVLSLAPNTFYAFQIDTDKNCTMIVSTTVSLSNVTGTITNS